MDFEEVMRVAALNKQKAKSDLKSREQNMSQKSANAILRVKKEREMEKQRRKAEAASKPSTSKLPEPAPRPVKPQGFKIPKTGDSSKLTGPSSDAVLKYQQRKIDEAKRKADEDSKRKMKQKEALIHERLVRNNGKVNKRMADQLHVAPERLQQLAAKYYNDVEKRQRETEKKKLENKEHHRRIAAQSTSSEQSLVAERSQKLKEKSRSQETPKEKPRGNDLFSLISQQSRMLKRPSPTRPTYSNKNVVIGQPIRDDPKKTSSSSANGHRTKSNSTNGHASSSSSTNHHRPVDKPSSSSSKRRVGGPVDFTEVLRIAEANKRGERVPTPPPPKKMVKAFKSNSGRVDRVTVVDERPKDNRMSHYSKLKPENRDRPTSSTSRPSSSTSRPSSSSRPDQKSSRSDERSNGRPSSSSRPPHAGSSSKRSSGSGSLMVNGGGVNIDDLSPDQLREMIARMQERLGGGGGGERRKEKRPRHEEPRRERVEKCSSSSQYSAKPNYPMFNTRRPIDNYEESDSEDSSMDDFIDDEPLDDAAVEKNELRNTLRDLYKYDRRRFAGERQYDDRSMESRWQQCEVEDRRSMRMAREEDAREEALGRATRLG